MFCCSCWISSMCFLRFGTRQQGWAGQFQSDPIQYRLMPLSCPASQDSDQAVRCKCMHVPFKIANGESLSRQTHVRPHFYFCLPFVFLHDLCTFLYLEASHNIFQCFCLSLVMHSTQHKHAKKTRTLSSRQMAAVSSSGRGGHGRCPAETAWGIDWSETLAFRFSFPVCLLSPKVTLSRQWPHVTSSTLSGCLAER